MVRSRVLGLDLTRIIEQNYTQKHHFLSQNSSGMVPMLDIYEFKGLLHEYLQFSEVTNFSPKVELRSHIGV